MSYKKSTSFFILLLCSFFTGIALGASLVFFTTNVFRVASSPTLHNGNDNDHESENISENINENERQHQSNVTATVEKATLSPQENSNAQIPVHQEGRQGRRNEQMPSRGSSSSSSSGGQPREPKEVKVKARQAQTQRAQAQSTSPSPISEKFIEVKRTMCKMSPKDKHYQKHLPLMEERLSRLEKVMDKTMEDLEYVSKTLSVSNSDVMLLLQKLEENHFFS